MNRQFFIGVGLTALLAVGVIMWLIRTHKDKVDQYESLLQSDKDVISYHLNKAGQAVAEAAQAQMSLTIYKETHPDDLKAILKDFGIKQAQLQSFVKASFEASGTGETVIRTIHHYDSTKQDTVTEKSFDITDGFLALHGSGQVELNQPWLKLDWDYSYQDTIEVAGITKKKWFGGRKSYFVEALLKNKKAKITSLKDLEITDFKDKRFGLGPAVIYDPFSNSFRVGISLQYNLIRF